jgi:hypothetical protein
MAIADDAMFALWPCGLPWCNQPDVVITSRKTWMMLCHPMTNHVAGTGSGDNMPSPFGQQAR